MNENEEKIGNATDIISVKEELKTMFIEYYYN